MDEGDWLAERFEENRPHLRAVAYRVLGSASEADDAVQEAWLRFSRSGAGEVENLGGWLTTIVARVSLNMLQSRRLRREDPIDPGVDQADAGGTDPEHEAVLADSVGLALLVVLDTLTPAERLAFVLHDMFAMPFTEVGAVLGRSTDATRQLASRARRRVRGAGNPDRADDLTRQREVAAAFLAAARGGDMNALITLLDADVTLTGDSYVSGGGRPMVLQGAARASKGAMLASSRAAQSRLALIDGSVGIIWAPAGRLQVVLALTVNAASKITVIDIIADPDRLRRLRLAMLPGGAGDGISQSAT